ncbi:MAG: LysM peptidoglycan-binding domain-containing protein [Arenicella sp.]|nr:LysM peptidoglycan-binding domain-containing protein [Arenicella sp.]
MIIIKANIKTSSPQVTPVAERSRFYQIVKRATRRSFQAIFALALTISVGVNSNAATDSLLADSYPDRYTVVKGDTLWGISAKFLRDPWRWPEVWQGNPQVENPDLIYPGDVLVLTFVDGRPILKSLRRETVKLSPSSRVTRYADSIPLVDPAAIGPYIKSPLVTDANEMKTAPYVVDGYNNRLILGKYDQFYVRGIEDQSIQKFRVFKPGRHFIDPVSGESLGWEAVHLGDANLLKEGDPARFSITSSYEDINVRDRLRPIDVEEALPFFTPRAPQNDKVRGVILDAPNKATELGPLSIVAINLGEREKIRSGDVLRVRSQKMPKKDPFTGEKYFIPEENIGLALVFRTFEKVSYAIITDSNRQVTPGDVLVSPNAE